MNKYLIAVGAAASLAVASPALAQSTQKPGGPAQGQQAQGQQSKGQQNMNEAMKGRRAVIGEVVDTREVQLKGVGAKHRLVKIKNKEGKNLIVDVGDATRTPAGRFKKGSKIVAVGKEARINDKPVLYAKYVGDLREAGSLGKQKKTQ
jgi:hypothetical protein